MRTDGRSAPTLVRTAVPTGAGRQWDPAAGRVLTAEAGSLRVIGGPGSGKTSLLADAAARRIAAVDAADVLVLTASRTAADGLRSEIARLLTAGDAAAAAPRTVREPLVRTVHSYAFGVLRAQAGRQGTPTPRLLPGAEQDAVIRELLTDDHDQQLWPTTLRPALTVPGFAEELRDLLMRAAERGIGPDDLVRIGRTHRRPEWVAAGRFWGRYEEVVALRSAGGSALAVPAATAYDAAELVGGALLALLDDGGLLAEERTRIRCVLVDDAQHLDPLQWRLVQMIGEQAALFIVAGDPDQAVFAFRGADPSPLHDVPPGVDVVRLHTGYRMRPAVRAAAAAVAAALPVPAVVPAAARAAGAATADDVVSADAGDAGSGAVAAAADSAADERGEVLVRRFAQSAAQAAWIANQLRRAHLIDDIAWPRMAIVVRTPVQTLPVLHRALRAAGVPIASAAGELPLARHPAVRPLLTALRAAADRDAIDADGAEELLMSPFGGADPLALRRLRRGLRRLDGAAGGQQSSDELLVSALREGDPLTALADSEAAALRRVDAVLRAGGDAIARGDGVEAVLWAMWQASGLQRRWLGLSERGGTLGRKADADLDAVVALFHAAEAYAERLPHGGVTGFADDLLAQRIAGDSLAPASVSGPGVEVLTAHAAAGREWDVVAIAGVQEGSWPDLRPRGSLLGVERLVDLMRGIDSDATSTVAPVLAEERRLFYLAVSRARRTLLVTACDGEEELPSRFLDDLAPAAEETEPAAPQQRAGEQRKLVLAELVGQLRAAACDVDREPASRRRAARQLARLAAAGVAGAHPQEWYGLAEPSTTVPLHPTGATVTVSPSTVEVLSRCPLRWLIERHGGSDPAALAAVAGTVVHSLAQAAAAGADAEELRAALDATWRQVDAGAPPWFARSERDRVASMLDAFTAWLRLSRAELTEVAVEADIDVEVGTDDNGRTVRLKGRIDRLERDSAGRYVIVDVKTGKNPIGTAEAREHPQLGAYQLAVTLHGQQAGGGQLLYVAKTDRRTGSPVVRSQDAVDDRAAQEWSDAIRSAATAATGPEFTAREGADCARCPAVRCCPLQPQGRQVTS